jgi:hypothetical protein
LVIASEQYGNRRDEYEPLAIDFTALTRLRRGLSSYIVQRASAADGGMIGGGTPAAFTAFSSEPLPTTGEMPRKIIIDDDAPAPRKPAAAAPKKKATVQYTNDY